MATMAAILDIGTEGFWSLKNTGPGVTEEKSFKDVDGQMDDRQTDDDGQQVITIAEPEPCSGEL